MAADKTCFVIMPISKDGTDEHIHYKALYDEVKFVITSLGYSVVRSDEVTKSGAITKDIVLRLAQADLVIADLTNLNPNVFYELGVRHSLRAQGTLMVLDETRTADLPFDLHAYRVIKFKGDLPGIGKLRTALASFVQRYQAGDAETRDNPVHDCLPALPSNALESSTGSNEGALREKLAATLQRLREYEELYPTGKDQPEPHGLAAKHLEVVREALAEASEGHLPVDLLERADSAVDKRDKTVFLSVVQKVLEKTTTHLLPRQLRMLANHSQNLGFDDITGVIFDHANRLYPKDVEVRNSQLAYFAHSDDPATRERARREIMSDLEIVVEETGVTIPVAQLKRNALLFGTMLDAFLKDKLSAEALRITEVAVSLLPENSIIVRNHARALENVQRGDDALAWYQKAIWCPDADDTSATWFGNELHNRERYVDAAEAYLHAAILDPDDAAGFSHFADAVSISLQRQQVDSALGRKGRRKLPGGTDQATVKQSLVASLSCNRISQTVYDRCKMAAARSEIDLARLGADPGRTENASGRLSFHQRLQFASDMYALFRSPVTDAAFETRADAATGTSIN